MSTLIVDIETIGEDFDSLDVITQDELTKRIRHKRGSAAYKEELGEIKNNLVFSPTTGKIVAIGVLDYERNKGVVYYDAPNEKNEDVTEGSIVLKQATEKQMLESFWGGASNYTHFVTFNGRGFDIPYIIARSAVHRVRITKDLMSNRYVSSQKFDAKHIDLQDQLGYYGSVWRTGGLHMWCRAFNISSPKEGEMNGGDVGKSFKQGKYKEIAQYNARDIIATGQLYEYWKTYMQPR